MNAATLLNSAQRSNALSAVSAGDVRLSSPAWVLEQEARALMTRLARIKPFVLLEPMLPAASVSTRAQTAIEGFLAEGRRELRARVRAFIGWLRGPEGRRAAPSEAQNRFTLLRMRFNDVLSQFDLFADALTQRSEHETGVWLAGLDIVAADALRLPGGYFDPPPVICYLDRGPGAAIRRARTRLPGGKENPVAIIRVPRERMVGSGIASSLVHEVGHQGAALLELVESLRPALQRMQRERPDRHGTWSFWERWISEIVADMWSVSRVGIGSTLGLMAVVSLPRAFVFRINEDDPHPTPWLRVKLSCAMGRALYPHEQWGRLARLWERFYPLDGLDDATLELIVALEKSVPEFIRTLMSHRPARLRGASLRETFAARERQPARMAAYFSEWRKDPEMMRAAPPALVFAVLGQARVDGRLSPERESRMLAYLLTYWALRDTLDASAGRAVRSGSCKCSCRTEGA